MKNIVFKITSYFKFQYMMSWSLFILIGLLMFNLSCSKSEELEIIDNETPVENASLIMYTDIEPDFTSESLIDFYDLDLNNDDIVDFTLKSIYYHAGYYWDDTWVSAFYYLYINSNGNDASGIISIKSWYAKPVPLDSGKEIFNLAYDTNGETYENWSTFVIGKCEKEGACPDDRYDWHNKNDKYLGLRFPKNGKMYYGWVRLEVSSATQWVIKDYAYNATPNKPILAGQKE